MNTGNKNSRRDFLKLSGLGLFSAAALGTLTLSALPAGAQAAKPPLLAETEPMAKNLGYVANATKVDTKKWPKRATEEAKKRQFCQTCILYNGGKATTDPSSTCALFAGKHVTNIGWCNSWNDNPKAAVPKV